MSGYLRTGKRKNAVLRMTLLPSGRTVAMTSGMNLLQALVSIGAVVPHNCDGKAKCGSCHVIVREGLRGLSKMTRKEQNRLKLVQGTSTLSRLACQALLGTHNVTVEIQS